MKKILQMHGISYIISAMEATKDVSRQSIEPMFLAQAQAFGVKLTIGQMNKIEHQGVIRDVGRYEINIEENGKSVTLLKQDISFLSVPQPLVTPEPPTAKPAEADQSLPPHAKPNIQQEFLDKAIKEKQILTLYLINGRRIKAHIEAYDNFTILVRDGEQQHLYYKHAITTINR